MIAKVITRLRPRRWIYFGLIYFLSLPVSAQLKLASIFGDGMVLQRSQPISIWGWEKPGARISVSLKDQIKVSVADAAGKWSVKLDAETAGGPYVLLVKGTRTIALKDVLIGDVWLCAGQSNMQLTVSKVQNSSRETSTAHYPTIRHFKIQNAESIKPLDDVPGGKWQVCSPNTVGAFTAVGYFFSREITNELNVPIGLINISRGGSNIEGWISMSALEQSGVFRDLVADTRKYPIANVSLNKEMKSLINVYPGLVFNAMVNPVVPYSIKGVLWYQGEANIGRGYEYRRSLALLINDWRERWGVGDFPFYYVQLPGFKGKGGNSNSGSRFAELRESQASVLSVPNTGMAVTIDIGEHDDIHPKNKQDVGYRLAAIALNKAYGRKNAFYGPLYQGIELKDASVWIAFDHIGNGLMVKDGPSVKGFEVAGTDRIFYNANAIIDGDRVKLHSDRVETPVFVRFAWADYTGEANLFNKEGFPAFPFRTDTLPGITQKSRYRIKPGADHLSKK